MVKFINGNHIEDYVEDKVQEVELRMQNSGLFKLMRLEGGDYPYYFYLVENEQSIIELFPELKEFFEDNDRDLKTFIQWQYEQGTEIKIGEVTIEDSTWVRYLEECYDDEQNTLNWFNSEEMMKGLDAQANWSKGFAVSMEVQALLEDFRDDYKDVAKEMDWSIIIDSLPQEQVYFQKIYEVFDSEGVSVGLYENWSPESAATSAYNSNHEVYKMSSEHDWTAKEIVVYGTNPNRTFPKKVTV